MSPFTSSPARSVAALLATADTGLAAWARERLPAAGAAICGEAEDAARAAVLAHGSCAELFLLDVALPGGALTALATIAERAPEMRVLMLATTADDSTLLPALRAGASGCLVGRPDAVALERAMRDLLAGHAAIPRAVMSRLVAGLGPD